MSAGAFRLDHVAIAVKDLEGALALYRDVLGLPVGAVERVADQAVDVAFVGEEPGRIELISPFLPDTGVAKFLEKRGEGLHHVAVRVPDIAKAVAELKAKGVPLIDQEPRAGAHGTKVAFVHPRGTRGVLLELVEVPPGTAPHGAPHGTTDAEHS
jgi:methylmalonyl-CoA/ethylmalonyl-CoA epimerase